MKLRALFVDARPLPFRAKCFIDCVDRVAVRELPPSGESLRDYLAKMLLETKRGNYLLSFFSYELGYLLEERLRPLFRPSASPLLYYAVFRELREMELFPSENKPEFKIDFLGLNITEKEYLKAIEQIKNYIAKGHTYQVNFTVKLKFHFEGDPFELFKHLLFSQRCEYACYLEEEDFIILSLSPELFLRKRGKTLSSSPMKGTLKRESLYKKDLFMKESLRKSEKTRAENVMIVDLIRNDLGRVCRSGTVVVRELFRIKTYPTLHQMISTVEGELEEKGLFEVLRSLFPCGSVTGAPKIRTMEIIRELEPEPRNIYTGALGFILPNGDFLFNVAIRTIYLERESQGRFRGELGIGAGIVWDSQAEKEYEETLLKARFLLKPLPYLRLFETFWWEKGCPNRLLPFHHRRLLNSANYFLFSIPKELSSFRNFKAFLEKRLSALPPGERYRIKFLLAPEGTIEILYEKLKDNLWKEPIRVGLIMRKTPKSVFHFHKTTERGEYDNLRKEAERMKLTEIILFDKEGNLLEGTISNIFLERGSTLLTPPLELGLLPGVLREKLIRMKRATEGIIKIEDLKRGDLFIGNSLRGLGKVSEWVIL